MRKLGAVAAWCVALGCGDDGSTGSESGGTSDSTTSGVSTDASGSASTDGTTAGPTGSSSGGSDSSSGACTPFDGDDDCAEGSFCLGMTATEGMCTPATDAGANAGDACGPALDACAEDRLCQAVSGGATICVDMCRLAMGDADCPTMFSCVDAYDLPEVGACAPQ